MNNQMREEFEVWGKRRHGLSMERWADSGEYKYHDTRNWWECWQAAWNRSPAAKSDTDWMNHPQTIEAKRQWDEVAQALGVDGDDVDAVLAAAKAKSEAVEVTEGVRDVLDAMAKCERQAFDDKEYRVAEVLNYFRGKIKAATKNDSVNAARYRWFTKNCTRMFSPDMGGNHGYAVTGVFGRLSGPTLDAAIDRAMQADAGGEG